MTTVNDLSHLSDAVFDERLADWEAAPVDEGDTVERVARAICGARSNIPWDEQAAWQLGHYRRMAVAAIAAMKGGAR